MTRIKFCGLTRADDVRRAVDLGVDAIGFVLTRNSTRHVALREAVTLRRLLPPFVVAVALFMDDELKWINEVIAGMQPDLLQLHGGESPEFVSALQRPYIKAVPMASVDDVSTYVAQYPDAGGFVLDGHVAGGQGGRGTAFDWYRAAQAMPRHVVLAGGLDAHNVAQAIAVVRPYAVDVSSGIESAPGIKHSEKMRGFVEAVRAADTQAMTAPTGSR